MLRSRNSSHKTGHFCGKNLCQVCFFHMVVHSFNKTKNQWICWDGLDQIWEKRFHQPRSHKWINVTRTWYWLGWWIESSVILLLILGKTPNLTWSGSNGSKPPPKWCSKPIYIFSMKTWDFNWERLFLQKIATTVKNHQPQKMCLSSFPANVPLTTSLWEFRFPRGWIVTC